MNKKELNPIQRFFLLIKPDSSEIRNVYIYAVFSGLLALSVPIGIQAIINLIVGGQISTSWVVLIVFVILGIIFSGILQVSLLRITENLQQKIFTRAAFEFAYKIPRTRLEVLYNHYAPELMNRFFDVISIQKGLTKILTDFSTASIQTIFGLILLSMYHSFFIVFSLILIILVAFIFKMTYQKGLDTSLKESKTKYNVAHWLQEVARTNISFKMAGESDLPLQKINSLTGEYVKARDSHFKILVNQYVLLIIFKVFVAAGLLIVGSILVIEQKMNIGQFVAAEIIILMILASVEKLILSLETIYDLLTSLEKIGQVTDLELELETGNNITEISSNENGLSVEFKNVNFNYPSENHKIILKDISFKLNACDKVLITGLKDSGKSTLLLLFAGLYEASSGSISFDDLAVTNLNTANLRSIIGDYIAAERIFEGTILENITMGREKATFENVQWAIKNVGLSDFIKTLPYGYDTKINPKGNVFSQSVVEKLILARSVVVKPKLLIIKDTFSSYVKEDNDCVFDFLFDKDNKWTLIIVSKNQWLKSRVNRQFFMENGILTEIK